jgi:hypothetical protein
MHSVILSFYKSLYPEHTTRVRHEIEPVFLRAGVCHPSTGSASNSNAGPVTVLAAIRAGFTLIREGFVQNIPQDIAAASSTKFYEKTCCQRTQSVVLYSELLQGLL